MCYSSFSVCVWFADRKVVAAGDWADGVVAPEVIRVVAGFFSPRHGGLAEHVIAGEIWLRQVVQAPFRSGGFVGVGRNVPFEVTVSVAFVLPGVGMLCGEGVFGVGADFRDYSSL